MGNLDTTHERDPTKDKIQDFLNRILHIEATVTKLSTDIVENRTKVSDAKIQLDKIFIGIADMADKLSAYSTTQNIENKFLIQDVSKLKEESKQLLENILSTKLFMGEYASIKTIVSRLEKDVAILRRDLEAHMTQYNTYIKDEENNINGIRKSDKQSFKEHIEGCNIWKKSVNEALEEVKKNKYGFHGVIIFLSFVISILTLIFGIYKITDRFDKNSKIEESILAEKQEALDTLIKRLEQKLDE